MGEIRRSDDTATLVLGIWADVDDMGHRFTVVRPADDEDMATFGYVRSGVDGGRLREILKGEPAAYGSSIELGHLATEDDGRAIIELIRAVAGSVDS